MGGSARSSLDPSELNACAKEERESAAARSLVDGGMLAQQSVHSDGFRSRQSWSEEDVVARRLVLLAAAVDLATARWQVAMPGRADV